MWSCTASSSKTGNSAEKEPFPVPSAPATCLLEYASMARKLYVILLFGPTVFTVQSISNIISAFAVRRKRSSGLSVIEAPLFLLVISLSSAERLDILLTVCCKSFRGNPLSAIKIFIFDITALSCLSEATALL